MQQLTYRGTVYPWQCDHMGHMNVMWYTGKFDEAGWQFFGSLGLTPAWLKEAGRGMAAVEQLTQYRRELHAGDLVSIHSELIDVKAKVLRIRHEMRRGDQADDVVAVSTLTAVFMDASARKACAFPQAMADRWREDAGRGLASEKEAV
ncbi:acyl-CoA thioesterase [Variovorax sp. J22R133]|uniref:acyl-CoA thioesterase n=1 Tax=Variovorax brevis TaxID=3053503 RepID=UPI002575CFF6|nr:acyl-CoA thioesterase [Variovorax sp. J22R133]MDM0114000.1 acyl-CoA thioesterase [Variovorax sp. J22R133]